MSQTCNKVESENRVKKRGNLVLHITNDERARIVNKIREMAEREGISIGQFVFSILKKVIDGKIIVVDGEGRYSGILIRDIVREILQYIAIGKMTPSSASNFVSAPIHEVVEQVMYEMGLRFILCPLCGEPIFGLVVYEKAPFYKDIIELASKQRWAHVSCLKKLIAREARITRR